MSLGTLRRKVRTIDSFSDEFSFLSNFSRHSVNIDGMKFPTAEHAFQAMKTVHIVERIAIRDQATPGKAKRLGNKKPPPGVTRSHAETRPFTSLRLDWETIKVREMTRVVRAKFVQHPKLAKKLLATDNAKLIEGNHWHDTFWGICTGDCRKGMHLPVGQNMLGIILMQIRKELS